jgi:hypothetical protein
VIRNPGADRDDVGETGAGLKGQILGLEVGFNTATSVRHAFARVGGEIFQNAQKRPDFQKLGDDGKPAKAPTGGAPILEKQPLGDLWGNTWVSLPADVRFKAMAIGRNNTGLTDVVAISEDNRVLHSRQQFTDPAPDISTKTKFGDWKPLRPIPSGANSPGLWPVNGAAVVFSPLAVARIVGNGVGARLSVFVVDTTGHVYNAQQEGPDSDTWSEWTKLPPLTGNPPQLFALALDPTSRSLVDLLGMDVHGNAFVSRQAPGGLFQDWQLVASS